jgi:hypothetical protein
MLNASESVGHVVAPGGAVVELEVVVVPCAAPVVELPSFEPLEAGLLGLLEHDVNNEAPITAATQPSTIATKVLLPGSARLGLRS